MIMNFIKEGKWAKMSRINELIKEYCPDGVPFKKVKNVYTRVKGTPITAGKMKEIACDDGEIRIFAGGKTIIDAHEKDIPRANITRVPAVLVTVSMPAGYFTEEALARLEKLIAAKGTLIKKALGIDELPIEKTEDRVTFPWFKKMIEDADAANAYLHFVHELCEMACNQKRISVQEREVENEKYAFRCFLLRLGFIGEAYKVERKILLKNLTGSSAFKNGENK